MVMRIRGSRLVRLAPAVTAVLLAGVELGTTAPVAYASSPVAIASPRALIGSGASGATLTSNQVVSDRSGLATLRAPRFGRSAREGQPRATATASLPGVESGQIPVAGAEFVAIDPTTQTLYVPSGTTGTLAVVDAAKCNAPR
jgi:hypothetical protein